MKMLRKVLLIVLIVCLAYLAVYAVQEQRVRKQNETIGRPVQELRMASTPIVEQDVALAVTENPTEAYITLTEGKYHEIKRLCYACGRKEVLSTIKRLNKEMGITVVLVTHFMDEAVTADRVVVMDSGKVIMDGTPREVFSQREKLYSVGLDIPQAMQLACALNAEGIDIATDILDENECADAIYKLLRSK